MNLENEFKLAAGLYYINHAAVSPWPNRTRIAIEQFAKENTTHGATHYKRWLGIELKLRQRLNDLINGTGVDDIALLKNTSEALSVIAYGLDWKEGDSIIITEDEFPSNRIVWESLATKGVKVKSIAIRGVPDPESAIINAIDSNTRLISVSSIQYASGIKLNINRLGIACENHSILFCVDAIQSLGAVNFDVQAAKAHFVVADGHKWMLGPEGLALFYCHPEVRSQLTLNQYGWHMVEAMGDYTQKSWFPAVSARRFECGSPNMLGIVALEASLSLLLEIGIQKVEKALLQKTQWLLDALSTHKDLSILSATEPGRYGGILTFTTGDDKRNDELFEYLEQRNVICASRGGGIRFSPHFYTSQETLEQTISCVTAFLSK